MSDDDASVGCDLNGGSYEQEFSQAGCALVASATVQHNVEVMSPTFYPSGRRQVRIQFEQSGADASRESASPGHRSERRVTRVAVSSRARRIH